MDIWTQEIQDFWWCIHQGEPTCTLTLNSEHYVFYKGRKPLNSCYKISHDHTCLAIYVMIEYRKLFGHRWFWIAYNRVTFANMFLILVAGSGVQVPSEVIVLNSIVLPHKELNRSYKNQIILWSIPDFFLFCWTCLCFWVNEKRGPLIWQ